MWKWLQSLSGWSWLRGARVAALSATAGLIALSPLAGGLEQDYALRALFRVRGAAVAPAGVVIVAIDRLSADRLGLPAPPRTWPRTFHAQLTDTLAKAGAATIVFDLLFTEERGAVEDGALAAAMRRSGRVALLQDLQRRTVSTPAEGTGEGTRQIDEAVNPIKALNDEAIAAATFPLPTDSPLLTSFWTFLSGTDLPTLPSVAFQLSASDIAADWAAILAQSIPSEGPQAPSKETEAWKDPQAWTGRRVVQAMTAIRHLLKGNAAIESRLRQALDGLEPGRERRLSALLSLYVGTDSRLLKLHGPAGTISTIPYASIINGDTPEDEIRGKVILVGYADHEVSNNIDRYETVYSDSSGIDINGVEILATGLANLAADASLRTSSMVNILIIIAVALILGFAAASATDAIFAAATITLLLAIPALGYYLFVSANFVAPLFTPLAVQLPIGILTIGLSLKTAERKLRHAMEEFLPSEIASRLTRGRHSGSAIPASTISAVFLDTDVRGFTTLAERVSLERLRELTNDYFGSLSKVVRRHGGEVLNTTADSMMCAFHIGHDPARARCNAIAAALDMAILVEAFGARHPSSPMPTRFGLCAGEASLSVVGSPGEYRLAMVGDVTNTASRLDSLSKLLNTTLLASAEVLQNVDGLIARRLGTFAPLGKTESVDVVEIWAHRGDNPRLTALAGAFAVCLAAFDGEGWSDAAKWFRALHEDYPDDGPTSFFLDLAVKYSQDPPPPGTARPIRVNVK